MIYENQIGQPTKGSVILIHGQAEHSGRYENLIHMLTMRGFEVHVFDWPGHGKSTGKRGHTKIEEGIKIIDRIADELNIKPYLFGHSMGGLTAIRYSEIFPEKIKGIVVSAPELAYDNRIPRFLINLTKFISFFMPKTVVYNQIKPKELSRNADSVRKYVEDPLVHDRISLTLNRSIANNMKKAYFEVDKIICPILILVGTEDLIVPIKTTKNFFKALRIEDKNLIEFDGAFHEIFEDPEWGISYHNNIVNWIDTH